MQVTFNALCRWLAPILSFTAEEAWGHSGSQQSVHLQEFPDELGKWRDRDVHNRMSEAIYFRNAVMREIEKLRQAKIIGMHGRVPIAISSLLEARASPLNRRQDWPADCVPRRRRRVSTRLAPL